MSIRFPDVNEILTGGTSSVRLEIPQAATQKASNTAFVAGIWFQSPDINYITNNSFSFLTKAGGNFNSSDGFFAVRQDHTTFEYSFKHAGSTYAAGTLTIGPRKSYCMMIIATSTKSWLTLTEAGGTAQAVDLATTSFYSAGFTSTIPLFANIGGATQFSGRAYAGSVEELFFLTGVFPSPSDVLDTDLVEDIAAGVQDLDTLDAAMTSGAKKCRYRMLSASDLSDAWGIADALTATNADATLNKGLTTDGPLRPNGMVPDMTGDAVSQCTFATAGDAASATATIPTEGGAYDTTMLGGTPTAIQARLLSDTGSTVVDWTTVDASPAAGVWDAGSLTAVPMTAGFLTLQFRAMDGASPLGEVSTSYGRRGAGFCAVTEGQSQLQYLYGIGSGIAMTDPMNLLITNSASSGNPRQQIIGKSDSNNRLARGMRRAAEEIHALFPYVPVQFISIGVSGESLSAFKSGGAQHGRWASTATFLNIQPDYYLLMYGHSGTAVDYEADLDLVVDACEAAFGVPVKVIQCPTARYTLFSDVGNPALVRAAQRSWVDANPSTAFWGGSWAVVATSEGGSADPNPADTDAGQGRSGALLAWALMMACGAVLDVPRTITAATRVGTTCVLTIGAVQ